MPVYRKGQPADAGPLAELAERTFRDAFAAMNTAENMSLFCKATYGPEIQARELRDPSIVTLLCEEEGRLVGYLQLRWGSPVPGGEASARPAEIQRIYVDKRWHGGGVAQRLMNDALSLAESGGADVVWLGVWEHNPRAIAFYRKLGFTEAGEHVFVVGTDPQRDVVMARPVKLAS